MGSEREESLERQSQGGGHSERALRRLSGSTGCAGSGWAGGGSFQSSSLANSREPRTVISFICKVGP